MAAKKSRVQTDLLETLSSHIARIEQFAPAFAKSKLIVSTDFAVEPLEEDNKIRKTPIAWPLIDYKMFYIVEVPAGVTIAKHSHEEAVFRVLISGSLRINERLIDIPGTWYVVPSLVEYEIKTETGYSVLSGYIHNCFTRRQQAARKKVSLPRT